MLFYISYNSSKLQSARSLNIWQSSFTRKWNGVFTKCLKENISAFQAPNPAVLMDTSGQCHYPVWLVRRPFPGAYWQWQLSTSHAVIILKSWVARIAHSWIYHRPGFPCASSLCHPRVGPCSQDMQNSWRNWRCQPPNEYFHTRAKCPTRSACSSFCMHKSWVPRMFGTLQECLGKNMRSVLAAGGLGYPQRSLELHFQILGVSDRSYLSHFRSTGFPVVMG